MLFRITLLFALLFSATAQADTFATDWNNGLKSRVRLVSAGARAPDHYLAGLEIELQPATITYWRNPGEAGLPPVLDLDGSQNLAKSELLFPAPKILTEAGALAFGYDGKVILPLDITPKDPNQPVIVKFSLSYAVCEKICIPAKASGMLQLSKEPGPLAADVQASLAKVPRNIAAGAGPLAIVALKRVEGGGKPQFDVTAKVPAGETADLFVEGPEDTYFSVQKAPSEAVVPESGQHFRLNLEDVPQNFDYAGSQLRLTLVTASSAIETTIRLDGTQGTP